MGTTRRERLYMPILGENLRCLQVEMVEMGEKSR